MIQFYQKQNGFGGNGATKIDAFISNYKNLFINETIEVTNEWKNLIINSSPDFIYSYDKEGRFTSANLELCKALQIEEFEILALTNKEVGFSESECIEWDELRNKVFATNAQVISTTSASMPDGQIHSYRVFLHPLHDHDGNIIGVGGITQDITDYCLIKTKLIEKQHDLKLLEAAIANTTDAVVIAEADQIDGNGPRIVFVNDAYTKMTGYNREEIIGKTPRILQGPKTDRNELKRLRYALEHYEHCEIEVLNYKKSGQEFWSSIAISPVLNDKNIPTHWIAIKRDTTRIRLQKLEAEKAIIGAQESEKYYIGRELHDNVAQLLVGSLLSLGMVKDVPEKGNKWLKQTIERIHEAINEIRKMSHQLAPATFGDRGFKKAIEALLKSINNENKFSIIFNFDEFEEIKLSDDLKLNLFRILQEQIQNIIKHAAANTIAVSIKIVDNMVSMRILDNGKGFNPGIRLNGIGLENIKKRTEMFYGNFSLKSSIGNGCEIVVNIPLN